MSSQCSRLPTDSIGGILGILRTARPRRAAHHDVATARQNARGAVYSASSLLGYTRCPLTSWGSHSVGRMGMVADGRRPLVHLLDVVPQALILASGTAKTAGAVLSVVPVPGLGHAPLLWEMPMEGPPGVLPDASSSSCHHPLDSFEDEGTSLIVHADPLQVLTRQVRQTLGVLLAPQRTRSRSSILEHAGYLPGARLGTAVHCRKDKCGLLEQQPEV